MKLAGRKLLATGAVAIILGGLVAGMVLTSGPAAGQRAANPALPPATAEVVRTTLVETRTVAGTLGYGEMAPISATGVGTLTWIAPVGSTVARGEPLFKLDGRPVVALYGTVPLYRTLSVGAEGADVQQLQDNLAELGYTGFNLEGVYDPATAEAVRTWQAGLGLPATGTVEPGQVVFTPGAVRVAEHIARVGDTVDTMVGRKPEDIRAAQAQVDAAKAKLDQARAVPQSPDAAAARAQVESARLKLEQTLAGGRAEDILAAQAQLDAATAKLQAVTNPRPEDVAAAQGQIDSANARLQALLHPRPEDVRNAEAALASARARLEALLNPRPEDVRNAEAALASARARLEVLLTPRPEDVAAAQAQLDQQQTRLAQLLDQPAAKQEDIWNAELAVSNAQVAYDKALADAANVGRSGGPATEAAADAATKQALNNLQIAQNNLSKLRNQGPSEWEVRQQQLAVNHAQAALDKLRNPSPSDVQAAQAAVDQALANLDKLTNPSPYDVQQAQAAVDQAEANLDKVRNPSPHDVQQTQEAVNSAQAALSKLTNPSPAEVAAAQQAIVQAQATLDKLVKPSDHEVQQAQQALVQAQANLDKLLHNNQYDVQAAQAAYNQALANLDAKLSNPTARGVPVLSYTGTHRLVTVPLRVADLALAVEGHGVTVEVPGRGTVEGEISQIGTAVANGTIDVTVTIAHQEALGPLTAAPVDAAFVSRTREGVLVVPVAALLALAEGGYGLEIVDGNTTRIVAVTTGMFAGGRVEVSGEGIAEGMKVGVPRR
jgi:peptidoglycan hydrolase-like protein with peptidoglycan-binding domain